MTQVIDIVSLLLNYKLLFNLTVIQVMSYTISIVLLLQMAVVRKVGFLLYILVYFNLIRVIINNQFVTTDYGLLMLNIGIMILLYAIYYFRCELKSMQHSSEQFFVKIENIIYGRLAKKFIIINCSLFIKACILFLLDNLINFNNILKEKIKFIGLIFLVFSLSIYMGSYEVFLFVLVLSFVIEGEKRRYRTNPIYKLTFDNNVFFMRTLEMRTYVNKPIKYFFVQKAHGWVETAREAAQNPKQVATAALFVAGGTVFVDGYIHYVYNKEVLGIYKQEYQDWKLKCDQITADNIQGQREWRESNTKAVRGAKAIPVQPTPIPLPPPPDRPVYNHSSFGNALSGFFGIKK